MERIAKLLIIFFISIIYSACGVYGFRGNNPPAGIKSVAVPIFDDISGFAAPDLAKDFTQLLKERIINDNTFRIADKKIADGILSCTITNVKDEALVVSKGETVTRRKITITVNVIFENLKKQKVVWDRNFENYGEYESSDLTFSKRSEGIRDAVLRITDDILTALTSDW